MKKSLFSLFAVTLLLTFSHVTEAFAVKHTVNVQNYVFVPANLNVQVGDTIRWVWINGVHTTTSTTIPVGAPSWDAPMTSSNPVFEYRVGVAGVYNYLCTPHSSSQIGSFTATMPAATLSVTPSNRDVTASSGSTTFSVTSNSNWSAVSNAGWCTVTSSGSGNGTIVANYQANTTTTIRVATITVTVAGLPSSIVTVTQAGAAATLSVTPSNQNVTADAGNTSFNVTSNTNWNAVSNSDWVTVTAAGSGNAMLNATYELNEGIEPRVALITVSVSGLPAEVVTVTQAGAETILVVDPLNQNVTYQAGTTSFTILSNTSWAVTTSDPWLTSTADGSGNGAIVVEYEENMSPDIRIATLVVSAGNENQIITITQEGTVSVVNNILSGVLVYPNPSNGFIEISADMVGSTTQLKVYDLKGNMMLSQSITGLSKHKLNASALAKGTYLLRLDQDNKTYITRIVIVE
jgi:plastocyanin